MKKLFLIDLIASFLIVETHISVLSRYIKTWYMQSLIVVLILASYFIIRHFIIKKFK